MKNLLLLSLTLIAYSLTSQAAENCKPVYEDLLKKTCLADEPNEGDNMTSGQTNHCLSQHEDMLFNEVIKKLAAQYAKKYNLPLKKVLLNENLNSEFASKECEHEIGGFSKTTLQVDFLDYHLCYAALLSKRADALKCKL